MNTIVACASPEKAIEIMGEENVIGPEDIQNTFGFTPENIPPILFSTEELSRAKDLGQQLILYVNEKDGEPFTLEDAIEAVNSKASDGNPLLYREVVIQILQDTSLRPGWRLTSPEVTEDTTDKNYLWQTIVLISYLKEEIFKDQDLPKPYQEAVEEFKSEKKNLQNLLEGDWEDWYKAAQQLASLTINQLLRENAPEATYRLILAERKNNTKNLTDTYTRTNSFISTASAGVLVSVGTFDSVGLVISGVLPNFLGGNVGACLSRSAS